MMRWVSAMLVLLTVGCTSGIDLPPPFCPSDQCTICGDGQQLGAEECDDGNGADGDGCSAMCTIETGFACSAEAPSLCTEACGDGNVVGAETCDDGNLFPNDGCDPNCRVQAGFSCEGAGPGSCAPCGDGQIGGGEKCDDGNTDNADGCSSRCTVEPGYSCDPATTPSLCDTLCGDGIRIGDEACDDENMDDDDGCSERCVIEPGWVCDGAGAGSCSPVCGDGLRRGAEDEDEGCDDGNLISGDGCRADCRVEPRWMCTGEPSECTGICGDGFVRGLETCDDANSDGDDGCSGTCTQESGYVCTGEPSDCEVTCGDGVQFGNEDCDDGNTDSGDGCNSSCQEETGFNCAGTMPSVCAATCGDGMRLGNETCDDMNTSSGDGCSSTCQVEPACGCVGEGAGSCQCFLFPIESVAAGARHSCAALASGEAHCWGDNTYGQLGNGSMMPATMPAQVTGLTGTASMATSLGVRHSCALRVDGARCWGGNQEGQLGDPARGGASTPITVPGLTGIAVSSPACARPLVGGALHSCATMADGTMRCWGENDSGRLGDGTQTARPAPVAVSGLQGAVCAAAGREHTCAVLSDDSVHCWGSNDRGQLGDGSNTSRSLASRRARLFSPAIRIAAGGATTCAVSQARNIQCWGAGESGQLGNGMLVDASQAVVVSGLSDVIEVAVGERHACAVVDDNGMATVFCWGANDRGQLGDGTMVSRSRAAEVQGLSRSAVHISAGAAHTCVILDDQTARCWGANDGGQLGNGTMENSPAPVPVLR